MVFFFIGEQDFLEATYFYNIKQEPKVNYKKDPVFLNAKVKMHHTTRNCGRFFCNYNYSHWKTDLV
jgi:hypothetical protein